MKDFDMHALICEVCDCLIACKNDMASIYGYFDYERCGDKFEHKMLEVAAVVVRMAGESAPAMMGEVLKAAYALAMLEFRKIVDEDAKHLQREMASLVGGR